MERVCQCHGSNLNSHHPIIIRKPFCNQLICYLINRRGVFCITLRNFAVVLIVWDAHNSAAASYMFTILWFFSNLKGVSEAAIRHNDTFILTSELMATTLGIGWQDVGSLNLYSIVFEVMQIYSKMFTYPGYRPQGAFFDLMLSY